MESDCRKKQHGVSLCLIISPGYKRYLKTPTLIDNGTSGFRDLVRPASLEDEVCSLKIGKEGNILVKLSGIEAKSLACVATKNPTVSEA